MTATTQERAEQLAHMSPYAILPDDWEPPRAPKWTNISDEWGYRGPVTVEDYEDIAAEFGESLTIEEREDGIYIDGERVAEHLED